MRLRHSDITGAFGPFTTDAFTVVSGDERLDFGAGFTASGTIGDFVWFDTNADGKRDPGESGVGGVVVTAFDMDDNVVGSTQTDNTGQFMMTLPADNYYLRFSDMPLGYSATMPHMGSDDAVDSDIDHSYGMNTTGSVTVNIGQHMPNVDAGIVSTVLPVIWLGIEGINEQEVNHIDWTIAQELNVSHYELQRSQTAREDDFEVIGTEYSEFNNRSTSISYSLDDPYFEKGINYYRVKQIDFNGKSNYSEIVIIDNRNALISNETVFNVFPNPAVDQVSITVDLKRDTKNFTVDVIDQLGRRFRKALVMDVDLDKGIKTYNVDVSDLPKGMYTFQAKVDREVLVKKVLLIQE